MTYRLYGYWRSSSAYRIRIALHLKGIEFDNVPVHLVRDGGEQYSGDYSAKNPMGQVPTLEWEGGCLTQSMAILSYLNAKHPEPALVSADPTLKARAVELAEIVNSGIQPLQNLRVLTALEGAGIDKGDWGHEVISRGLRAMEARAADVAGTYLVGNSVSIADLMLIPQLYNARRFNVDLSEFPLLTRVDALCCGQPAFDAAHPDNQPDADKS